MSSSIISPDYNHYNNLPNELLLFNPLTDVDISQKEENELTEFYKLCNEFYSPEFGIKYLLNTNLYPFQMATIRGMIAHRFPLIIFTRGGGKTFILAVYAVYHAAMNPGSQIILVSASFRQSKLIFREVEKIYNRSPLLRAISNKPPTHNPDSCRYIVNESTITALPLGQGDKIRGERGHIILADEFNSIPISIFDIVVRGFGATQLDPWLKTRDLMLRKKNKEKVQTEDDDLANLMVSEGNKLILSGTAGFKQETLSRIYRQYSKIIGHKIFGKASEHQDLFKEEFSEEYDVDYRDYCIMTYTYKDLSFMMDLKMINNAKATMPKVLFRMEYLCEFADDTFGFFKVRDIQNATSEPPDGFPVLSRGNKSRQYVVGVDPAKMADRFAICVIEIGTPYKVRYVWTSRKQTYSYSTKKLREILRKFNIVGIAMDQDGGGVAVEEIINKSDVMSGDDRKIYRYDDDSSEAKNGLKMLYMFKFNTNWIDEANTLLQKNIEDKIIMFPMSFKQGDFSSEDDDAIFEINEMKKELAAIEVTHTKSGRRHFDLAPPKIKGENIVVHHKDRYSALLLANFLSSRFAKINVDPQADIKRTFYDNSTCGGWLEDFLRV